MENTNWLSDERIALIFSHLSNIIVCSVITGTGVYAARKYLPSQDYFNLAISIIIAFIGLGLFGLNFLHIFNKIGQLKLSKWLLIFTGPFYFIILLFLYEQLWKQGLSL